MNLKKLITGPFSVVCQTQPCSDFDRMGYGRLHPSMRVVRIKATRIRMERQYLFPWVKNETLDVWSVDASIKSADGRIMSEQVMMRGELESAVKNVCLKLGSELVRRDREVRLLAAVG